MALPTERPGDRSPARRDRPRAAALDRRARAWSARSTIHDDGRVDVVVSLTTPGCPIRAQFERAVVDNVGPLDGRDRASASASTSSPTTEKPGLQQKLGRPGGLPEGALAQVKNVICVASGKGGVGKSTMTANLAAALSAEGQRAGALDCDVYGYSIPRMLGVNGRPRSTRERKIIPPVSPGGVKVMSIGFFVEENAAVVWRGPMLHKAIQQFLEDVDWGELDYLLLDLPPGTGDVSMTLAQLLPQARDPRRHDPPAGRADRRRARRRDGRQGRPRGARRDREHVRLHRPPTASASRSSARAAARCSPTSSTCRCSARFRSRRRCASTPTPATPLVIAEPDAPAVDRDPPGGARDHRRDPARAAADAGGRRRTPAAPRRSAAPSCRSSRPGLSRCDRRSRAQPAWWARAGDEPRRAARSTTSMAFAPAER